MQQKPVKISLLRFKLLFFLTTLYDTTIFDDSFLLSTRIKFQSRSFAVLDIIFSAFFDVGEELLHLSLKNTSKIFNWIQTRYHACPGHTFSL